MSHSRPQGKGSWELLAYAWVERCAYTNLGLQLIEVQGVVRRGGEAGRMRVVQSCRTELNLWNLMLSPADVPRTACGRREETTPTITPTMF